MKTKNLILTMSVIMVMGSTTVNGQNQPNMGRNGGGNQRQEQVGNNNRNDRNDNKQPSFSNNRNDNKRNDKQVERRDDKKDNKVVRNVTKRGINSSKKNYLQGHDITGYEDRVRYENGYWCYLRDDRWYRYDKYIEPSTFYSRPLSSFGTGVVVGTILGGIISALVSN